MATFKVVKFDDDSYSAYKVGWSWLGLILPELALIMAGKYKKLIIYGSAFLVSPYLIPHIFGEGAVVTSLIIWTLALWRVLFAMDVAQNYNEWRYDNAFNRGRPCGEYDALFGSQAIDQYIDSERANI